MINSTCKSVVDTKSYLSCAFLMERILMCCEYVQFALSIRTRNIVPQETQSRNAKLSLRTIFILQSRTFTGKTSYIHGHGKVGNVELKRVLALSLSVANDEPIATSTNFHERCLLSKLPSVYCVHITMWRIGNIVCLPLLISLKS